MTGTKAAPTAPSSIFAPELRRTTVGLLIMVTLVAFEAMAVAAALPTAARDLHGLGAYGWAFTGFLVASVVGMVAAGAWTDTHGPQPPLTAGMVAFLAGLVISGTATTMPQLIAGRVSQGAGGGLLVTAAYVVIGELYGQSLRPRVFAALSTAWVVPSVVGPFLSGVLTQHVSWRWAFLGLLPFVVIGAALMFPAMRALPPRPPIDRGRRTRHRMAYALVLAASIAVLEQAGQHPNLLALIVVLPGVAGLVYGLRPLVPRGTFTFRPGVPAPIALRGIIAGSFFGLEAGLPLGLQVQHGYSPVEAGMPLTCAGVSWALGSWWQGRPARAGDLAYRRNLVRIGSLLIATAAVLVGVAEHPDFYAWLAYPAWLCAGTGAGLAMSSASVLMLEYTTDAQRGADSAALQLSDATVSAVTTGLAGVLLAGAARHAWSYTTAFTALAAAMGGVALIGLLVAARLHEPRE